MTSARAVAAVKRSLPRKTKVGHTGTLDPLASGLLVLMVGKATRLSRYIGDMEKSYTATARFGAVSDSLDADGTISDVDGGLPEQADLESALSDFTGEIEQVPPMASAVKVAGRRLYDMHRAGHEVEREPRSVHVHGFTLADHFPSEQAATFAVRCGGGTYVRSLVADLAASLGTGAYLTALRREGVGRFGVSGAVSVEDISAATVGEFLLDPKVALDGMREYEVNDEVLQAVSTGRSLPSTGDAGEVAVVSETDGKLLAVYSDDGESLARPEVVLCAG